MPKFVINAWVSDLTFPGYMDQWDRLAAQFEQAHPQYTIAIRGLGFFTGPEEIREAIDAGQGPDIAEYYFYMTQPARDTRAPDGSPRYVSLEKAIGGRTEILGEPVVIDDIIAPLRDYYTYHGELTSMPSIGTTSLLYANQDHLDAAGIAELPRTWGAVRQACERIAAGPNAPAHAICWSNHGTFFQQALASQGGRLADQDNGRSGRATRVELASPEMLAWVAWWRQLHTAGHYLHTGSIPDWEGTFRAFADRSSALRISSSNDVNYMRLAAESSEFALAMGGFPYNEAVPYIGNAVAGTSLWLADGLDEVTRDGALAFLQFAHNPQNAARRHQGNSFLPLTGAAFALLEESGWFREHPYHRVASDHLAAAPGGLSAAPLLSEGALLGDFAGNQDVMTRAMSDVLNGADPQDRFEQATGQAQLLLDGYEADVRAGGPRRKSSLRVEHFTGAQPYSGADLENVVKLNR